MNSTVGRAPGFIAKTRVLVAKDARIEARGRDTLPPMLAFSLAVTLLLAFTLPQSETARRVAPPGSVALTDVLAGFFWVVILFSGLIAFARSFELEREERTIDALLLVPLDRSGLFVSKALVNLTFVAVVEALLLPLFAVLFPVDIGDRWPVLVLVVALTDIGFVAVGTLFASIAATTRSRELMLPILALPAVVPVFIAAVELTGDVFAGVSAAGVAARGWFGILIAFDVIFSVLGALAFEFVVD